MLSPYRKPGWFRRARRSHPILLVVGVICVAAVVVEVAVTEGWFHLSSSSSGATAPNLNPFHEEVLSVTAFVKYNPNETGGAENYFPALDDKSLCPGICPVVARVFPSPANGTQWLVGLKVFFNVSNTDTTETGYNLGNFSVQVSGASPTLLRLVILCCAGSGYQEPITSSIYMVPGSTFGFEAVFFSNESLPQTASGGFDVYLNATSP